MARAKSIDLPVFAALAVVMLITRSHSLSQIVHLPDTALASFFVAGFYIRSRLAMPALFALGFAIDVAVMRGTAGSDFCFTPAYAMLFPAYGVMWATGRMAAGLLGARLQNLPLIAAGFSLAVLGAEILSSGGFYFFSGRFAETSLAGFLPRLVRYFPMTLFSALIWGGLAAVCHGLVSFMRNMPSVKDRP